jgi:SpoVK/Ycf46/Vps4 family AAA+-type ATPase
MMDHQNTSIQKVADMLVTGEGLQSIVDEIIKLKVEAHNFFVNENSFYVCKIGTGNPFGGEAPGAIEVIPGEKPNAALDNIWGGGFGEIRDFIEGMQTAKKWSPLFLSTSPSGSTDKNNVLLVGPQGCGKTQVMRALGADDDSISIFAVGSDFLTCWMGEAQKNPKRLFDEAVKLHKSSGRPVHILIDEIDMVLNDDKTSGSRVNLSLEFQNLMDGVVAYPGISIWGATNHPKRIPTPMLRRFAKVMVVGELDIESRVTILRHYIEHFLPCGEGFSDEQYNRWAIRFDGATGDVIRKAVDEIWLRLMRSYISGHEASAEKVLEFINEQYGDNFEVSELTDEDAQTIRNMIGETSVVTVDLVEECISHLLDNFAVQQQIKVARDTYRNAALLLERQKTDSSVGF